MPLIKKPVSKRLIELKDRNEIEAADRRWGVWYASHFTNAFDSWFDKDNLIEWE